MTMPDTAGSSACAEPIVLGSRSPRRRDLLSSVVGADRLLLCPPESAAEPGFEGLTDDEQIEQQARRIVAMKYTDVRRQLQQRSAAGAHGITGRPDSRPPVVVVADTLVIASRPNGGRVVLGQPEPKGWQSQVREWFRELLSGRTHSVWTCFSVSRQDSASQQMVRSEVSFVDLSEAVIEWYLSTEESLGKAGGYGIQGHAAAFVCGLQGSLTNVIGLPLLEVVESLRREGIRDV